MGPTCFLSSPMMAGGVIPRAITSIPAFSCLRAIETRRSIARSANTGISCLINQRGEVIQQLGWWKRGAVKGTLNANDKLTYYVRNGDYIGRTAVSSPC